LGLKIRKRVKKEGKVAMKSTEGRGIRKVRKGRGQTEFFVVQESRVMR